MALTIAFDTAPNGRSVAGAKQIRRGTMTFDSSYDAGGEALAASLLELNQIDDLRVDPIGGYVFSWDKANAKVLAYRTKDPAAAGGADIVMQEVTAAVNLSAIAPRFRAEGI